MKNLSTYIFTMLLCYISIPAIAQLKVVPITIDFSDFKKSSLRKTANKGSLIQLQITNINRNQYSAQINNTQANYFTTPPPIFSNLSSLPSDVTEKTLETQSSGASFSSATVRPEIKREILALTEKQKEFADNLVLFSSTLEEYKTAILAIKQSVRLKAMLQTLMQDCSSDIDGIISKANSEVKAFVSKYPSILSSSVGSDQIILKGQLKIVLEHFLEQAEKKYENLKEIYAKVDDLIPDLQRAFAESDAKIKEQMSKKDIAKLENEDYSGKRMIIENATQKIKRDMKRLDDIVKSIEESNDFIQTYIRQNESQNIVTGYGLFTSNHYLITSAEVLDQDELLFDVILQPKTDATCPAQTIHLPIKIRTVFGFKLDFSTGLFLNFGRRDFFDQTYRLEKVGNDPDTMQIVKNSNRNKVLPSLGALLHGYIRTGGDLQPAVSLGVSLSAGETSRLNYHLGASLIIGKEQRLVASFGWTLTQATILDGEYSEGQIIPTTIAPTDIPTTSYYRWGNFFALNYNLSR